MSVAGLSRWALPRVEGEVEVYEILSVKLKPTTATSTIKSMVERFLPETEPVSVFVFPANFVRDKVW